MKRTVIAVVLAFAALSLLASLVLQSRSVPPVMHVAHSAILTELARAEEDYGTLVATLSRAWESSQAPGEGARALIERLSSSAERLSEPLARMHAEPVQQNRLRETFARYAEISAAAADQTANLLAAQSSHADDVTYLRESGAALVQEMRELGLEEAAADVFQLLIATLDYASPAGSAVQPEEVRALQAVVAENERLAAEMPETQRRLTEAAETILRVRPRIETALEELGSGRLGAASASMAGAVGATYATRVAAADQARTMLSLYAMLLLAAAAFVGYRLQQSYRELNNANAALESWNQSLEERVEERTRELAGTLAELKESQVQLVQAEKMSSLGQLVAGISHEINTPLLYLANNAVLIQERLELGRELAQRCSAALSLKPEAFVDRAQYHVRLGTELRALKKTLLEQEIEAALEEAKDLAKDSIDGLAELTEIAQSLKDFSRLDRAPTGDFDVNAGLDKTLLIARNIVKHKAEVHKFYGELPHIQCSPSKINQVFLNLITNAAQAIEDMGEIVITTRTQGENHVAIAIADTGCGISEEDLGKIRDPFFTTKEVGSGTGLGLSIVDEIIRSHGGELQVKSTVGEGSVFTVILPVKQTEKSQREDEDLDGQAVDEMLADEAAPLAEAI